jgi:hypothetical protein
VKKKHNISFHKLEKKKTGIGRRDNNIYFRTLEKKKKKRKKKLKDS